MQTKNFIVYMTVALLAVNNVFSMPTIGRPSSSQQQQEDEPTSLTDSLTDIVQNSLTGPVQDEEPPAETARHHNAGHVRKPMMQPSSDAFDSEPESRDAGTGMDEDPMSDEEPKRPSKREQVKGAVNKYWPRSKTSDASQDEQGQPSTEEDSKDLMESDQEEKKGMSTKKKLLLGALGVGAAYLGYKAVKQNQNQPAVASVPQVPQVPPVVAAQPTTAANAPAAAPANNEILETKPLPVETDIGAAISNNQVQPSPSATTAPTKTTTTASLTPPANAFIDPITGQNISFA